jgi:hypothetical protein
LLGVWAFFEGAYGIQKGPKSLMGVGGGGEKTQPARGGLWNARYRKPLYRRRKRRSSLLCYIYRTEPEKAPLKAAPDNRILFWSCGKTKAEVAPDVIWSARAMESAPEEARMFVAPRTALKDFRVKIYSIRI